MVRVEWSAIVDIPPSIFKPVSRFRAAIATSLADLVSEQAIAFCAFKD
jgi:hypothetical protein